MDSDDPKNDESVLYDVGRYEARNYIMGIPGAVAPVVFGGKIRTVLAYLDRREDAGAQLVARRCHEGTSTIPTSLLSPAADAKLGDTDYIIDSNSRCSSDTQGNGGHPAPL